jgi:hypothetical protein
VVILSSGRIVAEHDAAEFVATGSPSLEDTCCRVTQQVDFRPLAREILDTLQA